MTAVEGEINQIYAALIQFFKQSRSDMDPAGKPCGAAGTDVNLLNWQNSIEYQCMMVWSMLTGRASKIVCMVRVST